MHTLLLLSTQPLSLASLLSPSLPSLDPSMRCFSSNLKSIHPMVGSRPSWSGSSSQSNLLHSAKKAASCRHKQSYKPRDVPAVPIRHMSYTTPTTPLTRTLEATPSLVVRLSKKLLLAAQMRRNLLATPAQHVVFERAQGIASRSTSVQSCAVDSSQSVMTIAAECKHELIVKKSRFVARARHVRTSDEAMAFIKDNSDPKASHNCFAFSLSGGAQRSSNDGEPGGTAGPPILAAIEGSGYQDVAVVVTRYYGGIKLGTGGLVRAYGGAASACLHDAMPKEIVPLVPVRVRFEASDTGAVYSTLGQYAGAMHEVPGSAMLEILCDVPPAEVSALDQQLTSATKGRVGVVPCGTEALQ
mmetsp:Transcript_26447/g.55577  ORF Transcript_26447/g.55577 Transcript_26447/m.55577 type:complete len:357 (+) Transcript_26447:214-1284(+)